MQKLRRRRSRSKVVKFSTCEAEKHKENNIQEKKKLIKPAQRIGSYVRYGNTVFELRENKKDSIYCTILEVSSGKCESKLKKVL